MSLTSNSDSSNVEPADPNLQQCKTCHQLKEYSTAQFSVRGRSIKYPDKLYFRKTCKQCEHNAYLSSNRQRSRKRGQTTYFARHPAKLVEAQNTLDAAAETESVSSIARDLNIAIHVLASALRRGELTRQSNGTE